MAIKTPPSEEVIKKPVGVTVKPAFEPEVKTPPSEELLPPWKPKPEVKTPPSEELLPPWKPKPTVKTPKTYIVGDPRERKEGEPPLVPYEELIKKTRPRPRPTRPPSERVRPLVEVTELPEGRQWESEPGMIEVVDPQGGMTSWRKTDTGYIQLGGETYETRWQPYIPRTPSKELRKALERMRDLTGEAQFREAEAIGFIPIGSLYIPSKDGEWTYLPADDVRRLMIESPKLHKVLITKGWDAYLKAQQAEIGTQRLVSEDVAVVEARTKASYESALKALEPYKSSMSRLEYEYPFGGAPFDVVWDYSREKLDTYGLIDAIKGGVDEEQLNLLFGKKPVDIARTQAYASPEGGISPVVEYETADWIYRGERLTPSEREEIVSEWKAKRDELIEQGRMFTPEWYALGKNPEEVMTRTPASAAVVLKNAAVMGVEVLAPAVMVVRHWDDLSPGEKAIYITIDAISVVFFASAAVRGARAIPVAGRLARLKGVAGALGMEARAQIVAPVNMIIHPIRTVKATSRQLLNLAENIAHPRKIPEAVITTSNGMVRFKVTEATSAAEAMQIRNSLIALAARGERPIIKAGDATFELTRSPLMREAGGGLAHATPDVEALVKGTRVRGKAGFPLDEQGLFLANEPTIRFAQQSAHAVNTIPVPIEAADAVMKMGKYKAVDLVKIDAFPVRSINFADANNIPATLAPRLQAYVREIKARLYGSFGEWIKNPMAARPNDIDIAVGNPEKVLDDILKLSQKEGFQARRVKHAIEIFFNNKWVKIADVDSLAHHSTMIPTGLTQPPRPINGIYVETLGEQYLRQSYGAVAKTEKASERAKRLAKAAEMVEERLKDMGAVIMKPGIIIYSPKTALKAVPTEKLWHEMVEIEKKFQVGEMLPQINQRLFTRVGMGAERIELWLEKPLSMRQIAKLKAEGLIEWIKAPFKEPIRISRVGDASYGLTTQQVDDLADILKQSGNLDQAKSLIKAERILRTTREIPARVIGFTRARGIPADVRRDIAREARDRQLYHRMPIRPDVARRVDEIREPERIPRVERETDIGRMLRLGRVDRPERPLERAERVERPPERLERIDRIERPERLPERPERPERIERLERIDRLRLKEEEKGIPRLRLWGDETEEQKEIVENPPIGTKVWIQGRPYGGAMIKVQPPPYRDEDVFTTRVIPFGYVDEGHTGKGSVRKSLQILGGEIDIVAEPYDMGAIKVETGAGKGTLPERMFVRDEADTYKGKEVERVKPEVAKQPAFTPIPIPTQELPKPELEIEPLVEPETKAPPSLEEVGTYVEGYVRRPKGFKNWWEDKYYSNEGGKKRGKHGGRLYRGHELLPSNLGEAGL